MSQWHVLVIDASTVYLSPVSILWWFPPVVTWTWIQRINYCARKFHQVHHWLESHSRTYRSVNFRQWRLEKSDLGHHGTSRFHHYPRFMTSTKWTMGLAIRTTIHEMIHLILHQTLLQVLQGINTRLQQHDRWLIYIVRHEYFSTRRWIAGCVRLFWVYSCSLTAPFSTTHKAATKHLRAPVVLFKHPRHLVLHTKEIKVGILAALVEARRRSSFNTRWLICFPPWHDLWLHMC